MHQLTRTHIHHTATVTSVGDFAANQRLAVMPIGLHNLKTIAVKLRLSSRPRSFMGSRVGVCHVFPVAQPETPTQPRFAKPCESRSRQEEVAVLAPALRTKQHL